MELHLRSNNSELYIGADNGNLYFSVLDSNSQRLNYTFCMSEEDLATLNTYFQLRKAANKPEDKSEEKQGEQNPAKNIVETWKEMRLEVYQQASGNRHEPNYSDDTTKMFSLNDIDEIIEKITD